jgi:competence protein ComEA
VKLKSTRIPWRIAIGLVVPVVLASTFWPSFAQSQSTGNPQSTPTPAPTPTKKPAPKPQKKIDINNATLSELRTLPLGEAEAKQVIANRPYRAKGELMTKAGLPEGVYFVVKDRVELQEPRKAAPKK